MRRLIYLFKLCQVLPLAKALDESGSRFHINGINAPKTDNLNLYYCIALML